MDTRSPGQCQQSTSHTLPHPHAGLSNFALATLATVSLMTGEPAAAACASSVIDTRLTRSCVLTRDQSLQITEQGAITVTSGAAVSIEPGDSGTHRLSNSGTLSGDQALLINASTVSGSLRNAASGLMQSTTGTAVRISGSTFTGDIDNAGRMLAPQAGYGLNLLQSTLKGSISNSGTVQGGLGIFDSRVTGSIANSSAGEMQLTVSSSSIAGSLRNAGRMTADGSVGMALIGSVLGGDVSNSGTLGGLVGLDIVDSTVQGQITNTGTLSGEGSALFIQGSTVRGGVSNAGEITASESNVIRDSTLGSLSNSGNVRGIESALRLENTFVRGDLLNPGNFLTSNIGYAALSIVGGTLGGSLVSTGVLNGGPRGYGLVTSRGAAIEGDVLNAGFAIGYQAIRLEDTLISGSLVNTGRLLGGLATGQTTGDGLAMVNSRVGGGLVNRGAAQGREHAVILQGSRIGGQIINTGTLIGPTALRLQDTQVDGGLVNAGRLASNASGGYSLYVDADSRLDTLYIAGQNARFQGAIHAPRTTATLYSTASYRLSAGDDWTLAGLVNRGTLILAAPASRAALPARVVGDYHQRSGAVLRTEVVDATHYGKLVVTGTAILPSNARIDVDVANASQPFRVIQLQDVLRAGTLKSDGTFVVTGNSALFDFGAVKDANSIDLTLTARDATAASRAVAATGSARLASVARVLDAQFGQGSASPLTPYFVSATSNAEVARDLAQTLPLGNAGLRASQAALLDIRDALQERLLPVSGPASFNPAQPALLWSRPFTSIASQGQTTGSSHGQVVGIDTRLSAKRRAGVAFAYARGDAAGDALNAAQSSRLDLWQFSGYNAWTLAPDTELLLYAGAGHNSVNGQRRLSLAGLNSDVKADYGSLIATAGASLGHAWQLSEATRWVPSLQLDYTHVREDSYHERGSATVAPLLLKVDARRTDQLVAGVGSRLEHAFSPAGTRLRLTAGVGYDLINASNAATARFAGAADARFTTAGSRASPWVMRGGLGLVSPLPHGAELSLDYSVQSRSDYDAQGATVQVTLPF
jgi:autotransporter family porin